MDCRVRGVIKLLWHPRVWRLLDDLTCPSNRPLHALRCRSKHKLRTHESQQGASLDRHRLRHRKNQLVTFGSANKRKRNTRVTARWLNNHGVLLDLTFALAGFDHRHADTILHAVKRLKEFTLREHGRLPRWYQPVEANHRRIADGLGDVIVGLVAWHCAPAG